MDYTYAQWPRRIASAVIDFLVITVLSVPLLVPSLNRVLEDSTDANPATLNSGEVRTLTILSIVVQVGYFTALHAWRGATVGKTATRTVLVRDDGQPVTLNVAFTRAVTLVGINFISGFLFLLPAIVNLMSPLWNSRRQTYHDRVARTIVVMRENLTE